MLADDTGIASRANRVSRAARAGVGIAGMMLLALATPGCDYFPTSMGLMINESGGLRVMIALCDEDTTVRHVWLTPSGHRDEIVWLIQSRGPAGSRRHTFDVGVEPDGFRTTVPFETTLATGRYVARVDLSGTDDDSLSFTWDDLSSESVFSEDKRYTVDEFEAGARCD